MSMVENKKHESWVLVKGVYGIELSKSINNEFEIDGVTLISKSKLMSERVRKRLKLPLSVKELALDCPTFAIKNEYTSKEKSIEQAREAFETLVLEISYIILATQVWINNDSFKALLNLHGKPNTAVSNVLMYNLNDISQESRNVVKYKRPRNIFNLDSNVLSSARKHGFLSYYLNLDKSNMTRNMKKDLRNSIIFLGRSQNSIEPYISFLNNMIAIDCLLSSDKEGKHVDSSQKKLEVFFGWTELWFTDLHKDNIKKIYGVRASMVHDGKTDEITIEHVKYTNFILGNLLHNLCKYPNIFRCKNDMDNFLAKVNAERVLGISSRKSKVLPKKFMFFSDDTLKSL